MNIRSSKNGSNLANKYLKRSRKIIFYCWLLKDCKCELYILILCGLLMQAFDVLFIVCVTETLLHVANKALTCSIKNCRMNNIVMFISLLSSIHYI